MKKFSQFYKKLNIIKNIKNFIANNIFIILILILALLKGIFWIGLVPALQTPDADRHFSTIMWYAETKNSILSQKQEYPGSNMFDSTTYSIPEEYREFLKVIQFEENRFNPNQHQEFNENSKVGIGENDLLNGELNPNFEKTPPTIVRYPFLYYETSSWFYNLFKNNSLIDRLYIVRFYTLFIGLVTVFVSFKTAQLLDFSKKNASLVAGIIAFQPMLSFMNTSINVDSFLILGMSLFVFFSISILKKPWEWRNVIGILSACFISVFSKPAGYTTLLFLILLFFYKLFIDSRNLKKKIIYLIISISSSLIIIYALYKLIPTLSKILSVSNYFSSIPEAITAYLSNHFSSLEQYRLFGSYWGWFGWFDYSMNKYIYLTILLVLIVGISSFFVYLFQKENSIPKKEKFIYIFLFLILIIFHLAIVYTEFNYFQEVGKMYGLQGRYFLPMLLPALLTTLKGYAYLSGKATFSYVLLTIFMFMILLNFTALFCYIIPAYYL